MVGLRCPPRGWLAPALLSQEATSSGLLAGAYRAAIRDFEPARPAEGPLRGPFKVVPVVGLEPTLL